MLLVPPELGRRTEPDQRTAIRGLLTLALAPGLVLWLILAGVGLLLTGPLQGWNRSESNLNRSLQNTRDSTWDSVTALWSRIGNTEIIIGVAVVVVMVLWWRTRRWWFAVIPAVAISLQAAIFVTVSAVIGRPRPDVPHLDPAPPTSSFPSGHVGASVALYTSLAVMATTIERTWLRRSVIGVCALIPLLVAYARLYRGMHHVSDIVFGAINGLVCAGLAANCLKPRSGGTTQSGSSAEPSRESAASGRESAASASPSAESAPSSATSTARFGARSVLAAVAVGLVAVPGALTLVLVRDKWAPLLRADEGARDSLHEYALTHDGFVAAMHLISNSGSAIAWQVLLAAVVLWLLWRRLPRLAMFVVITAAASSLLNTLVKAAVNRQRPVLSQPVTLEPGLSFPSGHAQAAIVGYAVLLLVFLPVLHGVWRKVAVVFAAFMVLAIGFSRVALGAHYVSDVLGGYILGAAWVAAMTAVFNALRVDRGRRSVDVREGLEPEHASRLAGQSTGDTPPTRPPPAPLEPAVGPEARHTPVMNQEKTPPRLT